MDKILYCTIGLFIGGGIGALMMAVCAIGSRAELEQRLQQAERITAAYQKEIETDD